MGYLTSTPRLVPDVLVEFALLEAVLPIEAVSVQPAASSNPGMPDNLGIDLSAGPVQQPSAADALDFSNVANGTLAHEVTALPPSSDGLSIRIGKQLEELGSHLKLHPDAEPSGDAVADGLKAMERAYIFAIEATMASRGSTESTKIFNTLLKGQ